MSFCTDKRYISTCVLRLSRQLPPTLISTIFNTYNWIWTAIHHCCRPKQAVLRRSTNVVDVAVVCRSWSYQVVTHTPTLLPAVHFLEQAFAGADFSTEKFSAALSLISAALFQCPKIAKFSVAHFFKLSCDLRCSFSIAKSRKILRCSSSDIWKGSKLSELFDWGCRCIKLWHMLPWFSKTFQAIEMRPNQGGGQH